MAAREGWTETTLGDIASWSSGKNLSSDKRHETGLVPILGANGIIGRTNEVLLDEELITVGRVGACGETHRSTGPVWISDNALIVIPKEQVIIELLFYVLSTFNYQSIISGTTQPLITQSKMKSQVVNLPPLTEQKRIVDVVSSVDAYIDALQKQVDSARTARNAVLHELLSAGGDDWTETTLGDIAKCAGGTAFPHKFQGGDTGTPFVKVSDMNESGNERFLSSSNNHVSKEAIKSLGARVWPMGTIVFAKVGAALLTEKRRILVKDTIFDNNIMGLVPTASIESHFLYLFMETVKLGDYVQPGAVPSVNNSIVSEIAINLPPLMEQRRIVEIVSSMDEVIQSTEQAIVDAKNLRSGLLSDLLSGEHEIPASYDVFVGAA
jgi:type I restriction enzyme S subunit